MSPSVDPIVLTYWQANIDSISRLVKTDWKPANNYHGFTQIMILHLQSSQKTTDSLIAVFN